jgi:phosphoribosylformylglycinamidine cyclo-ligase
VKYLAGQYPESYDTHIPLDLVYSGQKKVTERLESLGTDVGKLILSPTRTYAPVIKLVLDQLRHRIHGMVHVSGGAQTKILNFVDNLRITKNNLFPIPPLFKLIQEQSGTDWKEMYKVFNMGHRMEIYLPEQYAEQVIAISKSFNIDAQIIGFVSHSDEKELIIKSEKGKFEY